MQRAFYWGGKDRCMEEAARLSLLSVLSVNAQSAVHLYHEVAQCPVVPILLFGVFGCTCILARSGQQITTYSAGGVLSSAGATLNEFQRPQDEEPHCLFAFFLPDLGASALRVLQRWQYDVTFCHAPWPRT